MDQSIRALSQQVGKLAKGQFWSADRVSLPQTERVLVG
jgi:hypothetical protein